MKGLTILGIGGSVFQRALAAEAGKVGTVTPEMIKQSEWIAGLDLSDDERARTVKSITRSLASFEALRKVEVGYDIPPAIRFLPEP